MAAKFYQSVPGFFAQDSPHAQPAIIGALPPRFGLLDDAPDRWITFRHKISQLNQEASDGSVYKVFFLGRHGEGFHNVAIAKYGKEKWDNKWSRLDGDGELAWGPDPDLTEEGKRQAAEAHACWKLELPLGMPSPTTLYCSPLTRAMRTSAITFGGISADRARTLIVENCREEYGDHTCDKRRSRTLIRAAFPQFEVEEGFAEEDELWTPQRESKAHAETRARAVLDLIFGADPEQCAILLPFCLGLSGLKIDGPVISITAHAGIINAFLRVVGRQNYTLPTGGVLPVVIKGTAA